MLGARDKDIHDELVHDREPQLHVLVTESRRELSVTRGETTQQHPSSTLQLWQFEGPVSKMENT